MNVAKNLEIKEISKDLFITSVIKSQEGQDVELNDSDECNGEEKYMTETAPQEFNSVDEADAPVKDQLNIETHQNTRRNFTCEQCKYQSTRKEHLIQHIKNIHEDVKYSCSQCDQKFSDQSNVNRHIKSKHEGVKYACSHCNYEATLKSSLTIHIKSKHEGVKYACNQCDHQATQKMNLTQHIKSKHKGLKYTCEHCTKEVGYQSKYKHLKTCKASRSIDIVE